MSSFFTELTLLKGLFYASAIIYVLLTAFAVSLEPHFNLPCEYKPGNENLKFGNALYTYNPCKTETRYLRLMWLTPLECAFGRHIVASAILGGIIGYERRTADRPAGIRTMSLVSLAACLFTINSIFAFIDGPMHWDPARVSAAVPSGVGFLGAGLIVKSMEKDLAGEYHHTVKGLNTAASIWLSAAVGVACGGGLYFVASFTAALMLCLLRFGPRSTSLNNSFHQLPHALPPQDTEGGRTENAFKSDSATRKKGPTLNYD